MADVTRVSAADSNRWKMVSLAFGVPVVGFGILQSMGTHEHAPPPPNYDYLKRATRVRLSAPRTSERTCDALRRDDYLTHICAAPYHRPRASRGETMTSSAPRTIALSAAVRSTKSCANSPRPTPLVARARALDSVRFDVR